jgi:hypothetical protein
MVVRGRERGFEPVAAEGSPQHRYAERRRLWREAYLRWIKGGRVALKVEPLPELRTEAAE